MQKINLTDAKVKSLKAAASGARYDVMDTQVPGFGVRVSDKGRRTFVLYSRFPGGKGPTRRAIGEYPSFGLAEAREKAGEWRKLIGRGIDPALVEAREREEAARRQVNTFAAVAEDFLREKVLGPKCYDEWKALEWKGRPVAAPLERKGFEVRRDLRNNFLGQSWAARPITDLTDLDVLSVINGKKRQSALAQARNLLGLAKRVFGWAVDQRCYGLTVSPVGSLRPNKIIGDKMLGKRVLTDAEIFALWRAAARTRYPHGAVYQLLMLTGLRLNECADASRQEFDFTNRIWTIPAERMKGKNGKAHPHVVPLTSDVLAILKNLPSVKNSNYLFSTTAGKSPVWMSDKIKKQIDKLMLEDMRKAAGARGDDPDKVTLPHWTNHDIRRSVRSGLSRLKIAEEVREAVLAHVRPGIKGVYDHHDYLDEKREALELWAARVRGIVNPPPSNVVPFVASA